MYCSFIKDSHGAPFFKVYKAIQHAASRVYAYGARSVFAGIRERSAVQSVGRARHCATVAAVAALLVVAAPLEFGALLRFDRQDIRRLAPHALPRGFQVTAELLQAGWLKRRGVIGPFPVRSFVKCRSFHVAPSAYAAMSMAIPK